SGCCTSTRTSAWTAVHANQCARSRRSTTKTTCPTSGATTRWPTPSSSQRSARPVARRRSASTTSTTRWWPRCRPRRTRSPDGAQPGEASAGRVEAHHGVVELLVGERRLGKRMRAGCAIGVEHEGELAAPGARRGDARGIDHATVRPDERDDVAARDVGAHDARVLGADEHLVDVLADLVVEALGLGTAGEASGEEVVEPPVAGLEAEEVLQVGGECPPRVVDPHDAL